MRPPPCQARKSQTEVAISVMHRCAEGSVVGAALFRVSVVGGLQYFNDYSSQGFFAGPVMVVVGGSFQFRFVAREGPSAQELLVPVLLLVAHGYLAPISIRSGAAEPGSFHDWRLNVFRWTIPQILIHISIQKPWTIWTLGITFTELHDGKLGTGTPYI